MNAITKNCTTGSAAKVLIIDDEPTIRERLQELSESLGFTVGTATDGCEGLEVFKEFQPDLVILDIYMPKMNGIMTLSKIREIRPNCPVILITGFLHYEQLIKIGQGNRPDGCIVKPLNLNQTSDLMLKLLSTRSVNHKIECV